MPTTRSCSGFRIPNLTRDLFAEGALSSAFVPTFTEYLDQKKHDEAARLSNLVATALIIVVVGSSVVLGVIFARSCAAARPRLRGSAREVSSWRCT